MDATSVRTYLVYDPLYGFIRLTPVEHEIIGSSYYQRLRWIKQLGFSFYIFPGAEHSRFGHSIGVLHNSDRILKSCNQGVPEQELIQTQRSSMADFHQKIRLAALLHDIGTFPFSHTTEDAYIKFNETNNISKRDARDDHENLGSFIIKNTNFSGGITAILEKYNIDPQEISDLVKGVSDSVLANQILHSEIDCDRMDYLLRDAHYTGLEYGTYDRDYLLHHFQIRTIDKHRILTIKKNAIHCVEDFLSARFSWYSQVVRSPRGAKWDALASVLTHHFLKKGFMLRYSQLLDAVKNDPHKFFSFNDSYFFNILHSKFADGSLDDDIKIKNMAECLIYSKGVKSIKCDEFSQRLLSQDDSQEIKKYFKKAQDKFREIEAFLKQKGGETDWLISDIPTKQINFIKSKQNVTKDLSGPNFLLERDPVKISYEDGSVKLLSEVENSVISKLQDIFNFIPNVYCSETAYEKLKNEKLINS